MVVRVTELGPSPPARSGANPPPLGAMEPLEALSALGGGQEIGVAIIGTHAVVRKPNVIRRLQVGLKRMGPEITINPHQTQRLPWGDLGKALWIDHLTDRDRITADRLG